MINKYAYNHFFLTLQLATEYGIKFMETSAKSSINVEEVILSIITVMSKDQNPNNY